MQENKYPIKQWAKDDQPREKLLYKGPESLSNAELLAVLIQAGKPKRTALELGRDVMKISRNNLVELGKLSIRELMKVNGIGQAKAVTIAAALELGRRRQSSLALEKPTIACSADIAAYLQPLLKDYRYEVFAAIFLNRANRINHFQIFSQGGITGTVVDPRHILKKALEEEAVNLILCHNHPSGNLKPSAADQDLTLRIKEAARYLDIKVLDHLIVSETGYFSFADEGLL